MRLQVQNVLYLYLGGGIISSGAAELVREFAQMTQIPAVETFMARGTLHHEDPLLISMLGMHGSYAANMAMSETDLVIGLGARFDDRVTGKLSEFAKNAQIIHVDIDPASISKLVNAHFPIVGDVKNVVESMMTLAKEQVDPLRYGPWHNTIANFNKLHPLSYTEEGDRLKPQWVVQRIGQLLGDDANISTDVGSAPNVDSTVLSFQPSASVEQFGWIRDYGIWFSCSNRCKASRYGSCQYQHHG